MENRPRTPDDGQGHIRISNKEKKHFLLHRRLLLVIASIGVLLLTALTMMLIMKNYTDRRIAEANNLLIQESKQYGEFEKMLYARDSFLKSYDAFSPHLVGIAHTEDGFLKNVPQNMATGVLYDQSGNILVPARMVRGRTTVFVRTFSELVKEVYQATVVGIDEPSGMALVNVPALSRSTTPEYKENPLTHLNTVLVTAVPSGNPDHGNLTIAGVHTAEDRYTVDTGNNQMEVTLFTVSTAAYEGNDGGAVLAMNGTLAGIISRELTDALKLAPFAAVLPTSELKVIAERIIRHETVESISLGIVGEVIDYAPLSRTGYYVLEVKDRSTADRGGIRPTDIILTIDGQPIIKNRLIDSYMKGKKVGDDLTVELLRAQSIVTLVMKVY